MKYVALIAFLGFLFPGSSAHGQRNVAVALGPDSEARAGQLRIDVGIGDSAMVAPVAFYTKDDPVGKRPNDYIVPTMILGGAVGIPIGIVWGVMKCSRTDGCVPVLGHMLYAFVGMVGGMGAGMAGGAVVGTVIYVVKR